MVLENTAYKYETDKARNYSFLDLTHEIDRAIISNYDASFQENLSEAVIVALGSYAQEELCPYSDIDILIVVDEDTSKSLIEKILESVIYPLWNKGLDVSHSVRSIKEIIEDTERDFFFLTSILSPRFICGAEEIFTFFLKSIERRIEKIDSTWFLETLLNHNKKRYQKFGDLCYLLEPNIKEGEGGLRDYHSILWASKVILKIRELKEIVKKGIITEKDLLELKDAVDFLLKVRVQLHYASNRKNDRLYFEYQPILSRELGFSGDTDDKAVEEFMSELHRHVFALKSISHAFFEQLRDKLDALGEAKRASIDKEFYIVADRIGIEDSVIDDITSHLILRAFKKVSEYSLPLHPETRKLIRENLSLVTPLDVNDFPELCNEFLDVLEGPGAKEALLMMLEMGILEIYLPEFKAIRGRRQFDVYHAYTIDLHSILTLQELISLEQEEEETFRRINSKKVLFLSGLLHDIGKGIGKNHQKRGGEIAFNIARRLGLSSQECEEVKILVSNHLKLAETALRRDLSEERVAFRFARDIGNPSMLSMLYLLTIADSKATGPLGFNRWKESLIKELYIKTLNILEKGALKVPEDRALLDEKWNILKRRYEKSFVIENKENLLDALPQLYVMSFNTEEIFKHIEMAFSVIEKREPSIEIEEKKDYYTVTVISEERPGLFTSITGVMAMNHLDIRNSRVFTWFNGLTVEEMDIIPPWEHYDAWEKVKSELRLAIMGRIALTARISNTKPPLSTLDGPKKTYNTKIVVDNESSDYFTVIEVYAKDRLGLLYDIARALNELNLNVYRALISNKGDLAADVFYVIGADGSKIEDFAYQEEIKRAIEYAIG